MLRLDNICYKNILRNINLEIYDGEFVIITGENGAGKTTLFNIISGQIKPSAGKVLFNNFDIHKMTIKERSKIIANVLQDPRHGTIAEMTIFENMRLAHKRGSKRYFIISNQKLKNKFKNKLSVLGMGLENRINDLAGNLSGGQRQALSLVMAILSDYQILLLDEITASLDRKTTDLINAITSKIAQTNGKICLAITHDKDYIAQFPGRIVDISKCS